MKIVRLINNTVVEIIPYNIPFVQLAQYYNAEFAAQCVGAPDDVEQQWTYVDGVWTAPAYTEPEPPPTVEELQNRLAQMDAAFMALLIEILPTAIS